MNEWMNEWRKNESEGRIQLLLVRYNNGSLSLCDFHREESERVNHILLVTILNPMYPITTVSHVHLL